MNNPEDQNFIMKEKYEQSRNNQQDTMPIIDFSTFIFSLNSSALVHLGAVADPTTGETGKNLTMAKQTIDILGVLEEKTEGNLTQEESSLLKHILYDLRLQYVKKKDE